jgi:transcriptional regulator with XRE-family HTH domain
MSKTKLGLYLRELRIQSGAQSVTEYIKSMGALGISETYYRALESGQKTPAIETLSTLSTALGADSFMMFQYYLQDVLPSEIYMKLVNPVAREAPSASPKEALEKKEELLATYRAAIQRSASSDLLDDVYLADDEMVQFLDLHFDLLPLVHFIYMADRDITSAELQQACEANNIKRDLKSVIALLRENQIADVRSAGHGAFLIRRFSRMFRLPKTQKGKRLRARWMKYEVERSTRDERADQVKTDGTFSTGMIARYNLDRLGKVQDRISDLLAELHAASSATDDESSFPFFVNVLISPRPEYGSGTEVATAPNETEKRSNAPRRG